MRIFNNDGSNLTKWKRSDAYFNLRKSTERTVVFYHFQELLVGQLLPFSVVVSERQRHLSDINNQTSGSFFDPRMRNESARSSWKNETDFTSYLSIVYIVGTTVLYVCLCLAYNQQPINFFSKVRFVISTLFWFL